MPNISARNPWVIVECSTTSSIRNCLGRLLSISEQHPASLSSVVDHAVEDSSTSKFVKLQKEISLKNKRLVKTRGTIEDYNQELQLFDIVHLNQTEKHFIVVKQLCSDLDTVLKNIETLINCLQKPFINNFIKMNASYHRFANEVFIQLVLSLNELSLHTDNITWISNNNFVMSELEPLLAEIQSTTATIQTSFHTVSQMREGIAHFYKSQK
ncbi:uncharacterized protein LOC131932181 [Physella acuta]|uniref:uncharacterized protein LOC131932181 n=1 Tax=Physella acuta TaxID=109671 RepID=UPI0027DCE7EB|nr:uncharacterized protein LOC131932181 [Physella acuta]